MSRTGWFVSTMLLVASLGLTETGCLITYDADGVDLISPTDTTPRLFVIAPEPNAQVGDSLAVQVEPRNFSLVPHWGQANVATEGHLFVTIDGTPIESADGATGAAAGEVAATSFSIDTTALAAGEHRLMIEVRNNDRTRFAGIQPIVVEFTK